MKKLLLFLLVMVMTCGNYLLPHEKAKAADAGCGAIGYLLDCNSQGCRRCQAFGYCQGTAVEWGSSCWDGFLCRDKSGQTYPIWCYCDSCY